MGKKKRNHPEVEEVLARPWCYYCERDFDDLKILTSHQKAKHFKCDRCGRRLNTAGGLSVHMNQVHKETLTSVENALPNRSGLEVEIFGMEGIPEDVTQAHNQRMLQQFYEAEAARRATTGNPAPGQNQASSGPKKPKFEAPSDLKRRLAEHKAKKAAQEAAGGSSGNVTPMSSGQGNQSPGIGSGPGTYPTTGSPQYLQQSQGPFGGQQGTPPQTAYAQPFGQPPFGQTQAPFNQQPGFGPPPSHFSPPNAGAFAPPGQQYPPPAGTSFQAPFQAGPPRQFGASSPSTLYSGHPLPHAQVPSSNGLPQHRPGSASAASGLPQRPAFGAPPVNPQQMQQMHQGHVPGQTADAIPVDRPTAHPLTAFSDPVTRTQASGGQPNATSVDELISSAAREADVAAAGKSVHAESVPGKKSKKDKAKDRATRLVYTDDQVSPEEKMASLPRYSFVRDETQETVMDDVEAAVTGTVRGADA